MSKIMELADDYAITLYKWMHTDSEETNVARAALAAEVEKLEALSQPVSMEPVATEVIVREAVFGLYDNDYLCYHVASAGPANVELTFDKKSRELVSSRAVGYYAKPTKSQLEQARQQGAEEERKNANVWVAGIVAKRIAELEQKNAQLLEALKEALEIMKADWQQIDQEWGPSEGGLEAAMDGRLTGYGYFQKAIAAIQAAEVKP